MLGKYCFLIQQYKLKAYSVAELSSYLTTFREEKIPEEKNAELKKANIGQIRILYFRISSKEQQFAFFSSAFSTINRDSWTFVFTRTIFLKIILYLK